MPLTVPASNSSSSSPIDTRGGRWPSRTMLALTIVGLIGPPMLHGIGLGYGNVEWLLLFMGLQIGLVVWLRKSLWLCVWPVLGLLSTSAALWTGLSERTAMLVTAGIFHAALYSVLGTGLGLSLRRGHVDLITALARRLDPNWRLEMEGYTRSVAVSWTAFFWGQCMLSGILALTAPREVWSFFVLILDLPLVVLMFAAEYAVRLIRFPDRPHVGPLSVAHALRQGRPW